MYIGVNPIYLYVYIHISIDMRTSTPGPALDIRTKSSFFSLLDASLSLSDRVDVSAST